MNLSPELLIQIQAAINAGTLTLGNPAGRSPMKRGRFQDPRQLDNLTLLPTKDDPRPTFFWSAVAPRDGFDLMRTTEYPRLLWHKDAGTEITVDSAEEEQRSVLQGYVRTAPAWVEPDPMDALREAWAGLSKEDQDLLMAAQKQDRLKNLQAQLGALPEEKLSALLASAGPVLTKAPQAPPKERR
jgi:hypothetical protein